MNCGLLQWIRPDLPNRFSTLVLCVAIYMMALPGRDSFAAIINVPADFSTIQAAIAAAADGDEIVVQPGSYSGTVNPQGKSITIRSVDPEDPQVVASTTIDAQGNGPAIEIIFGESLSTLIDGFTITGGNNLNGGGISIFGSDPVIRRCVFVSNSAKKGGGAYLVSSSAVFDRCVFFKNEANDGGGVYEYACILPRFENCDIVFNIATQRGGGVASDFGSGRYSRCLIARNEATQRGGGIWGTKSVPLLVSTILRDNVAPRGAAIYADDTSPRLLNSTVVRNLSTSGAGGFIDGIYSQPLVRNSIVRDNGASPVNGVRVNPVVEYSNFQGGASGTGNIDTDPQFINPGSDDFRLQPNSPSVDTGFNGWVASYSLADRDGQPRIQAGLVDMGAFEVDGFVDPSPPKRGPLVVGLKDESNLAFGMPLPLISYDPASDTWIPLVRNLPALGVAVDVDAGCYWIQNGETGMLTRVPFDTLRPQEIGIIKEGIETVSVSGLALRDGVLYGVTGPFNGQSLYTIDTTTGKATQLTAISSIYDVWDLEFDAASGRMLFLSSAGSLPSDPLGVYQIDLQTFAVTQVQQWVNSNPTTEAPALQGLAVGDGRHYLLRSLYNDLEVYDADTLTLIDELALPNSVPGVSWVLGGMAWTPSN